MSLKILFVDVDCPSPLDGSSLDREPLGGTESTLFRIAEGLATDGKNEVVIAQHNRETPATVNSVRYLAYEYGAELPFSPDAIVVLRSFKIVDGLRRKNPSARLFLWMHCFPGARWKRAGAMLNKCSATVICVSEHLSEKMREITEGKVRVVTIYNPVCVKSRPSSPDMDKLVFFSSPHKGLDEVLESFSESVAGVSGNEIVSGRSGLLDGAGS